MGQPPFPVCTVISRYNMRAQVAKSGGISFELHAGPICHCSIAGLVSMALNKIGGMAKPSFLLPRICAFVSSFLFTTYGAPFGAIKIGEIARK